MKIDLPLLPPIDKNNVTVLTTFLYCAARGAPRPRGSVGMLLPFLAACYVLAPIGASFGNSYELRVGNFSLPGFYLLDGIKGSINNLIQISAFYIGLRFLSSATGRLEILKAFVASMLMYSVPMLAEERLSPQLHNWVYGYSPFSFIEHVRWNGYRPVVFLPQGLQLALFVAMALIAACTLARVRLKVMRLSARLAALYLVPILIMCKTLAAGIYAVALAPLALFARPTTSVKVATALMVFVCAYPALRTQDLVPIESVVSMATNVSKARADSFVTRIENESILMAKANQKPVFGWGGWGRNRVYNSLQSKDVSITDGGWIIYFGVYGWVGFLGLFGMFAVSVHRLHFYVKSADDLDAKIAAGLALLLAANIADMLPNANLTPITFIIAGSIARRVYARAPLATAESRISRMEPPTPIAEPSLLSE